MMMLNVRGIGSLESLKVALATVVFKSNEDIIFNIVPVPPSCAAEAVRSSVSGASMLLRPSFLAWPRASPLRTRSVKTLLLNPRGECVQHETLPRAGSLLAGGPQLPGGDGDVSEGTVSDARPDECRCRDVAPASQLMSFIFILQSIRLLTSKKTI